ncbi:DUF4180 domain-containing protein [Paenibacillus silviterrae]|uniref:DUF4180 domain-containing protein n=1 Tax=Paenibacillus silviterrae TaxID=3242194 RepID=UPI002542FC5B|nr:DUF4180 domain-containing protein [Paenibacillus chinjuensis]
MNIAKVVANGVPIAVVSGSEVAVEDAQSALDLLATVRYETDSDRMILHKSLLSESFFDLSTRLAGEVVQKFINYRMKLAIVGDFSTYSSKSLKHFIYESNNGTDLFFLPDVQQAIDRLSRVS